MATRRVPGPFAKVMAETSITERERRNIRKKESEQRKKNAKNSVRKSGAKARAMALKAFNSKMSVLDLENAVLTSQSAPAGEGESLTTSSRAKSSNGPRPPVRSNKAKTRPVSPPRKRREGLRDVEYTYGHYQAPKVVVRRNKQPLALARSVPRIPLLPGQEDIPFSDSEDDQIQDISSDKRDADIENQDKGDDDEELTGDYQPNEGDDACSEGTCSTMLETASDAEDFMVEFGESGSRSSLFGHSAKEAPLYALPFPFQGGPTLAVPAQPLFHVGTAWNFPYHIGPGFGHPQAATTTELAEPPIDHPFGPPDNLEPPLNDPLYTPEDIPLINVAFPDNAMPIPTLNPNPFTITYNPDFPSATNSLGIVVDSGPSDEPAFEHGADVTSDCQNFEPYPRTFLEQMADTRIPGLQTESGLMSGSNVPPLYVNQPLAPPPPQAWSASPLTSQFLPALHPPPHLHAGSPEQAQTSIANHERKSLQENSLLQPTPSRAFACSASAPLHIRLYQSSPQPEARPRAATRPNIPPEVSHDVTPARSPTPPATPISNTAPDASIQSLAVESTFDEPSLPFSDNTPGIDEELRHGTRRRRSDSDVYIPEEALTGSDGLVIRESEVPPQTKRIRLLTPAPTAKELDDNTETEVSKLRGRWKYHRKEGAAEPKKGAAMGSFPEEQQGYMAIERVSIMWDQITLSPWSEPDKALLDRAIERADKATKMNGEDFARAQKFIDTMMRAVSTCRSQFITAGIELVREGYSLPKDEVELKDAICNLMSGDRFMFDSDEKHPNDFFKNSVVMDMTVELFFTHGSNLGGIFMRDLLREEDLETRRRLFQLTAKYNHGEPLSCFDYADMSPDALRGPPIAAMAFAGIV
ncbi:hypothetical protein FRC11_000088, partial [Ceratobasidium sp. 423]